MKKLLPFLIAAAVAIIALAVGIGIYNTPANRLRRQLDLGNKYLEEQNYEHLRLSRRLRSMSAAWRHMTAV